MGLALLRDAKWFGRSRADGYAKIFVLAYVPNLVLIFIISSGAWIIPGVERGTDFYSFWAAAKIAVTQGAAAAYDGGAQARVQGLGSHYYPFMYPPQFLALIFPLGLMAYAWAYLAWAAGSFAAYVLTARKLVAGALWPVLAYPAAFINLAGGQSGAITASLFCGAALTLGSRPFLAGMLLGGFIIKPHLALLFPMAMIAGRRWKVIAGAVTSAGLLTLLSLLMFGPGAWDAFFSNAALARTVTEDTSTLWPKVISLFGLVRLMGGSGAAGYGAQLIVTLGCAAIVYRVWRIAGNGSGRGGGDDMARMSILAVCSALATPYALDYDLVLLIVPICWLAAAGSRDGFAPWSKAVLATAYVLPFVSRGMAALVGITPAWFILVAFLAVLLRAMGSTARDRAAAVPQP